MSSRFNTFLPPIPRHHLLWLSLFESQLTEAFSVLAHGHLPAHADVQITEQWDYPGQLVSCLTWHKTGWHSEFAHLWHLITRNPFGYPQNEREHLMWRCLSAAHWFRMYDHSVLSQELLYPQTELFGQY